MYSMIRLRLVRGTEWYNRSWVLTRSNLFPHHWHRAFIVGPPRAGYRARRDPANRSLRGVHWIVRRHSSTDCGPGGPLSCCCRGKPKVSARRALNGDAPKSVLSPRPHRGVLLESPGVLDEQRIYAGDGRLCECATCGTACSISVSAYPASTIDTCSPFTT